LRIFLDNKVDVPQGHILHLQRVNRGFTTTMKMKMMMKMMMKTNEHPVCPRRE
jgi:hypothetical protein